MRLTFGRSSSATCDDSDDPAFDNDSRWPRRLLHLPTWTSHPWRPGNVYGGQAEPKYVALSYTWGRWQLADGIKSEVGGLPIRGVPWTIPRVDPDLHFTMEQFTSVLHKILQDPQLQARHYAWRGTRIESQAISTFLRTIELRVPLYRYIWLDIACIDQRYNENTLAEIGRQARIFQHAEEVYVWLSRTRQTRLQSLLTDFGDAALKLEVEPYIKDQTAEQLLNTEILMGQVLRALEGLYQDPWFTSLWTLQEAYLCPGAIVLSSEGIPVTRRGRTLDVSRIESLELIFSHANSLSYWLTKTNYARSSPHFLQIMNLIRKTGLEALWRNNPMALLGVSHSRKASHELDHVYGIMQAFGSDFKIGNTKVNGDRSHEYTLAELQDEFGAAILEKYPILSQMHVYLEEPAFGKGWCLQTNSIVPEVLECGELFGWLRSASNRQDTDVDIESHSLCSLSTRMVDGICWAYLAGKACKFSVLRREWRAADRSEFARNPSIGLHWQMGRRAIPSIMVISLDKSYRQEDFIHTSREPALFPRDVQEQEHQKAEWVIQQFGQLDPTVFLLGRGAEGTVAHKESCNAGLIMFRREERGIIHWHRIGVCLWLISSLTRPEGDYPKKALLVGESAEWEHVEGLMG